MCSDSGVGVSKTSVSTIEPLEEPKETLQNEKIEGQIGALQVAFPNLKQTYYFILYYNIVKNNVSNSNLAIHIIIYLIKNTFQNIPRCKDFFFNFSGRILDRILISNFGTKNDNTSG